VPYALSGYTWANPNVSVSFMPDGTLIASNYASNLFATYNAAYPMATWQHEIARALQVWADVSNLNFHFVADDGSPQGTAGLAQGDSRFGDIRIGGYNMGSGILGLGWNPGSTTTAGDVELSTSSAFAIGSMPDLASVVMHEVGHAIGFNHSLVDPAVMEGGLWGVYPGPYADDIAGVQAMYGARQSDVYDATASNNTLSSATALSLSYGGVTITADITTMSDVDYYKVTAPSGTDGTLTVSVDARNLSLFDPQVAVYNSSGTQLATASASTYGDIATVNLTGLVAGQTYYLRASGATTDAFGMGAYKLTAQFGGFTPPPPPVADKFETNNTISTATQLGTVSSVSLTGLTLHTSTDVDYFAFTPASKATFTVSITPSQGSGPLSLVVLNAQQTVLASGQSQTGGVTLSVSLASGQQYYVKVSSPTGSLFTYDLSIAKSSGGGGGGGGHKLVPQGADNPDGEGGDFFYRNAADDPENAHSAAASPVSSLALTPISNTALPAGTNVVVAQPATAGTFQPGREILRLLPGVLLNLGPQAPPVLPAAATVPVAISGGPNRDTLSAMGPDLRLALPRVGSGSGAPRASEEEPDEVPATRPVPAADPADTPFDPEAGGPVGGGVGHQACDACFADGSWMAVSAGLGPPVAAEDSGQTPGAVSAAMALAIVLGGYAGAHRAEPESRRHRRFRR
jgi:hypothetical protein